MSALNLQNGQVFSATQNSRQLITAASFAGGGVTAFSRGYAYDAVLPRLTGITDNVASSENRGFGYDALNRLETASGPWGAGSFKYDLLGNLRQQVLGTRTIDADCDATNRVTKFKDSAVGPGWQPVMNDARGNVVTRSGQGFGYDAANQPVSAGPATVLPPGVTTYPPGPAYDTLIFDGTVPYVERRPATPGGTTGTDWTIVPGEAEGTYVYDGNLKRVKQVVNGKTIYSVYSTVSGKISVIDDVTSGERFALLNLGPVSIRFRNPGGAEYTAVDHLGSPVASTNASGALLWRESYNPFGEKRIDPSANRDRPGFTGHIDDDATGLTYMQARYYDPVLGRFLSTDPIGYSDQRNLYAYVVNEPIGATDPHGLETERVLEKVVVTAKRHAIRYVEVVFRGTVRLTAEEIMNREPTASKFIRTCIVANVEGSFGGQGAIGAKVGPFSGELEVDAGSIRADLGSEPLKRTVANGTGLQNLKSGNPSIAGLRSTQGANVSASFWKWSAGKSYDRTGGVGTNMQNRTDRLADQPFQSSDPAGFFGIGVKGALIFGAEAELGIQIPDESGHCG